MTDVRVDQLGTVALISPLTATAKDWIDQHVEAPAWAWQGGGLAVEPRLVDAIIDGMVAAGFEVDGRDELHD